MSGRKVGIAVTFGLLLMAGSMAVSPSARAADPLPAGQPGGLGFPPANNPTQDKTWGTVSSITLGAAAVTSLLMPRLFYADPEVTVGWKARWHVSVLAPVMTLTTITLFNELVLKSAVASPRPGCPDTVTFDNGPCTTFGGPSSHAMGAFAALGHGVGVALFDSTKWSDGRINGASIAGNVVAPAIFAIITGIGRQAGNYESTAQIVEGGIAGLGVGFLTGMMYSLMQRPECGYTGSMICW